MYQREKERERERVVCVGLYVYIFMYMNVSLSIRARECRCVSMFESVPVLISPIHLTLALFSLNSFHHFSPTKFAPNFCLLYVFLFHYH